MTHPDMFPHRPPGSPERAAAERLDRVLFGALGSDCYDDMARAWEWLAIGATVLAAFAVAALAWAVAPII